MAHFEMSANEHDVHLKTTQLTFEHVVHSRKDLAYLKRKVGSFEFASG